MKKLATLTLIALFAVSSYFYAQPMQGMNMGKGNNYGMPGQMMKTRLGLSDEQAKKFDEIMFSQREAAIDTRAEAQKLRLEMQKIAASDNVDIAKLKKLNAEIASLQVKQKDRRLETWSKINEILTPEQRKTWAKMLTKFINHKPGGKRHGMRRGMHRGMRGKGGMMMMR